MRVIVSAIALLSFFLLSARESRDTIITAQNDLVILSYAVSSTDNQLSIDFSTPRILPSEALTKACKGEYNKLKVVVFDRIGDFGKVKWKGQTPKAFMVPTGLSYEKIPEGFYILGESQPLEFRIDGGKIPDLKLPVYVALYEKKQNYRIVSAGRNPIKITNASSTRNQRKSSGGSETERIMIQTSEDIESNNSDITTALSSINMVEELLPKETELPFSQTLQMEIYNLRSLKSQVKNQEILDRINDVLLACSDKEREIKEQQNRKELAAKAEQQAMLEQQKNDAKAQQMAEEEKARVQEEKQQKRTIWMIVGGVILGILAFVGNGVMKHFRDLKNQKSILQMQESIAKQAEHEAGRRTREVVRNKTHQIANKGRTKLRESIQSKGTQQKDTKRRSI